MPAHRFAPQRGQPPGRPGRTRPHATRNSHLPALPRGQSCGPRATPPQPPARRPAALALARQLQRPPLPRQPATLALRSARLWGPGAWPRARLRRPLGASPRRAATPSHCAAQPSAPRHVPHVLAAPRAATQSRPAPRRPAPPQHLPGRPAGRAPRPRCSLTLLPARGPDPFGDGLLHGRSGDHRPPLRPPRSQTPTIVQAPRACRCCAAHASQ
mmetsp:Transcript_112947/g.364631  ORF Transcript_112947/g.364631 Transcript_112947/m.364631 type:complete len:214 (+) Transcript_112947:280-921(+)